VARIPLRVRIGLYEDETALDCRGGRSSGVTGHWGLEGLGRSSSPPAICSALRQPTMGALHGQPAKGEDVLFGVSSALGVMFLLLLRVSEGAVAKRCLPCRQPRPFWRPTGMRRCMTAWVSPTARPPPLRASSAVEALGEAMSAVSAALPAEGRQISSWWFLPGMAVHDGPLCE